MTDTPDKLPALEAVLWMYSSPFGTEICISRWGSDEGLTYDHWVGWAEKPLTDLNRANEIIAEKEAEIARLESKLREKVPYTPEEIQVFQRAMDRGVFHAEDCFGTRDQRIALARERLAALKEPSQ